MKPLETARLILRKFNVDDFAAVHNYASAAENTIYMAWGPNTEEQTHAFISLAIAKAGENPCTNYQYAVILKETDKLIGACNLVLSGDEAEIGWILHRDYWKQGYGTEIGKELLRYGFDDINLHRIIAHCYAENYGSYRVMEKIGMRREGLYIIARPSKKNSDMKYGDEIYYAIIEEEWEANKEIAYYS